MGKRCFEHRDCSFVSFSRTVNIVENVYIYIYIYIFRFSQSQETEPHVMNIGKRREVDTKLQTSKFHCICTNFIFSFYFFKLQEFIRTWIAGSRRSRAVQFLNISNGVDRNRREI